MNSIKELFGSLKIEEPTDKIMREIDEKFKSRYDTNNKKIKIKKLFQFYFNAA